MEKLEKILVISRSPQECQKALDCGIGLAENFGAELCVLHTFYNTFGLRGWNLPIPAQMVEEGYKKLQEETKAEMNRMIDKARKKNLNVKALIREGKFIEEVIKVVSEEKIDLIVLASHSEWRLEHFFFGRDNEDVLRKLPCSVLFVKHDPEPAP